MNQEEAYKKLPLGTRLITENGHHWVKIGDSKWRCEGTIPKSNWTIGDIYTDFGDEGIEPDDKYILPFQSYLKEANKL